MHKSRIDPDADLTCPYCGTWLDVDDPDDFGSCGGMWERKEWHSARCPECGRWFDFHVTWEPHYGITKKVDL